MSEDSTTAGLLDRIRAFVVGFVALPAPAYADAVTLWIAHAHVIGASYTSPRLIFKSPEKESGKTRALEVMELLVPAPRLVMSTTVAAIYRRLKDTQITLLFDEVDAVFSAKAGPVNEELRALLNAGYRRGATVDRCIGDGKKIRVEEFPVFAAVALAAIGDLPDTIESRAIIVPMRRRALDEEVRPFRRRHVNGAAEELRGCLAQWASEHVGQLAEADPKMPDDVTDRAGECWEPLLAIAELAGEEWKRRAREAAVFVVKGRVADDQSTGVRLLADIRQVLAGQDRISSAALAAALNGLNEARWSGWNGGKGISQRDLARRLKPYGIESKSIRLRDDSTPKGYFASDLADPFARYLRLPSATSATSATQIRIPVADVADVADKNGSCPHRVTTQAGDFVTCDGCRLSWPIGERAP